MTRKWPEIIPCMFLMVATLAMISLFFLTYGAADLFAQDATHGKEVAQKYCASCHALESTGGFARPPSLQQLAGQEDWSRVRLRAWLATNHPPMPSINLTSQEFYGLQAYLEELKAQSGLGMENLE